MHYTHTRARAVAYIRTYTDTYVWIFESKVVPEGDAFGIVKAWKENGEDEREKREGQFISGTINVLDIMDSGLSYGPIFLRNYSTFLGSR